MSWGGGNARIADVRDEFRTGQDYTGAVWVALKLPVVLIN